MYVVKEEFNEDTEAKTSRIKRYEARVHVIQENREFKIATNNIES